jgi:hypothetical protein
VFTVKCRIDRHASLRRRKKGYKPEVTNPQHNLAEIFKGKVKNKITLNLCSRKID